VGGSAGMEGNKKMKKRRMIKKKKEKGKIGKVVAYLSKEQ
jgi:hypothetical protein